MNKYEKMLANAEKDGVQSYELAFGKDCGCYIDNVAYINRNSTNAAKHSILGEELGHHYTSAGDILNQNNDNNAKQEHKARAWGYEHTVPLTLLAEAINDHCANRSELAEYLEVTEKHLLAALEYYKQKYGLYVTINNYIIYFEPLGVLKLF